MKARHVILIGGGMMTGIVACLWICVCMANTYWHEKDVTTLIATNGVFLILFLSCLVATYKTYCKERKSTEANPREGTHKQILTSKLALFIGGLFSIFIGLPWMIASILERDTFTNFKLYHIVFFILLAANIGIMYTVYTKEKKTEDANGRTNAV